MKNGANILNHPVLYIAKVMHQAKEKSQIKPTKNNCYFWPILYIYELRAIMVEIHIKNCSYKRNVKNVNNN